MVDWWFPPFLSLKAPSLGLSVWSLHVLLVLAWVFSGVQTFPLTVRLAGESVLPMGENVSIRGHHQSLQSCSLLQGVISGRRALQDLFSVFFPSFKNVKGSNWATSVQTHHYVLQLYFRPVSACPQNTRASSVFLTFLLRVWTSCINKERSIYL